MSYSISTIEAKSLYEMRDRYSVLPACQREFVWKLSKQQSLIDSLLRGLPIPPLTYIESDIDFIGVRKELVDGQQRFTTICRFFSGAFKTGRGFGASERNAVYPDLFYNGLPQEVRSKLDNYKVPLLSIDTVGNGDIGLIFRRWQGGTQLTYAEKLFSFDGVTKDIAKTISEHNFWKSLYSGDITRRQAFQSGVKVMILESMGTFANMTAPRQVDVLARSSDNWTDIPKRISRRMAYVESLFDGASIKAVGQFILAYQTIMLLEESGFVLSKCPKGCLTHWYMQIREDALSKQRGRLDSDLFLKLDKVIEQRLFWKDNFDIVSSLAKDGQRDKKRFADTHDKIILWNAQDGKCPVCSRDLRFRDGVLIGHHVIPHSEGGPTTVDNMQLVHSECHGLAKSGIEEKLL